MDDGDGGDGDVAGDVPPERAARGLGEAWGKLLAWITAQGLDGDADVDFWEQYTVFPPAPCETLLVRPLKQ
jgi:hypothetical protein